MDDFIIVRYRGSEFSYHTSYDKYELEVGDAKLEYSVKAGELEWPVRKLGHDGSVSDETETTALEFIETAGKLRFAQALNEARAKWRMRQWGFSGSTDVALWRVVIEEVAR